MKISNLCTLCLICFYLSLRNFAIAANPEWTMLTDSVIETVNVTRTRAKVASEGLRVVNVLSKTEIERLPHTSLQELLDQMPGIDVRSRGANGVQADISMRGGTFDQVIVLLNGINITDPQTGHLNLELPVDLEAIDRIEVLQGTSMNIFGLSSFSGAINIITGETKNDKHAKYASASISGGDHGFLKASLSTKQQANKWTITANASYNQSSGYMDNTDYKRANIFAHAAFQDSALGNWNFQLGGQFKGFGANSFYSLAFPDQYENTKMGFAAVQWDKRIGDFGLEASFYQRTLQDRFELIRDGVEKPSWYKNHNHHITNVSGANIKAAWFSSVGKTAVGLELRNENIISNVLGDELEYSKPVLGQGDSIMFSHGKNRLNINYFVEQHFYINKFSASVGFSGNYNSMFDHNYAFGANVGYQYAQNSNVFASFNRAIRLPTFTDLYYKSATQIANPDLKPEESMTAEVGINYNKNFNNQSSLSIRASAYYRWGKNIIDWIKKPEDEQWKSMNHSNINAYGGEIFASYSYGYWLKNISASYSYCNINKDTDEYMSKYALDYLKHKFTAQLSHGIYRGFGASWTANYQVRNGEYIDKQGSINSYKPVFTLDGRIFWENTRLNIYIEASNITNAKYYDYGGIPQPGIWAKGGININI